jgi:rubrerythrin
MIKYSNDGNTAFYNGYKFRKDRKTGYFLSGSATDSGHRERLHVYVWRVNKGEIPKGFHVHHKDENKMNNELDNLQLLSPREHAKHHGENLSDERIEKAKKNLIDNAVPKSKEWHRSEEGHKWHIEHGIENAKKIESKEYICQFCGKTFIKKPFGTNKFCSNNCKSAYRRKSGVDNEKRVCMGCGKTFIANKYSTAKFCSVDCRKLNGWNRKHA